MRQESGQTYNFSNIRYAQPPVGKLRFAAPVAPMDRNTVVQDGSIGVICPQAVPRWQAVGLEFTTAFVQGMTFNYTDATTHSEEENASQPQLDPRTTEDCLFLDVIVPKAVFHGANKSPGAAVLVW